MPLGLRFWKINTNASWSEPEGAGGISWVVQSDCVNLINAINLKISDLLELSSFVKEIGALAASAHVVSFCWCLRSANGLAHCLARAVVWSGDWMGFFVSHSSSSSEEVVRIPYFIPDSFSSVFEEEGCGCG
ncbi:unnamed protein product [Citrullus colocynthis]|uniref:RNase H type-1 domain-containing protein n=1 Tax=Citrullus colocynthis TaxID=252529 RepID=A0ABP0Z9U5_9ROSI